ncbi:hypothetical protein Tco_0974899 [Tanacetum coccineum]|uniref:Uncharacterized protein n=1 Tax=Tanacetum coccineum TaxID=301880 RepID=A0ABQ5ED16_9ASTR
MEDLFRKHIDSLLKIGAIRPSKSRYRTMAMIINSGTTNDLVTGREVKGKERVVFNYKSLNDNTYRDQYSLPGINTIIKRIGDFDDSSVYSISEGEGDTHQSISVMVHDIPIEETVFMAIEEDDESDSEHKEEDNQFHHYTFMFHPGPPTKIAEMVQSDGLWKPNKELPVKSKECEHERNENTVTNYTICYYCGILTTDISRLNCPKCQRTTCALCARNYLGKIVNVKRNQL